MQMLELAVTSYVSEVFVNPYFPALNNQGEISVTDGNCYHQLYGDRVVVCNPFACFTSSAEAACRVKKNGCVGGVRGGLLECIVVCTAASDRVLGDRGAGVGYFVAADFGLYL